MIPDVEEKQTEETTVRMTSGPESNDQKLRKVSVFEASSRADSGIGFGIRSRNNSGNSETVRSRNNSGNESSRSRNNSGNETRSRNNSGPTPGLLQRSDSIVQFPVSPSPSSGIGSRNASRRSSSCSGRVITIQGLIHNAIKHFCQNYRSLS